MNLKPAYSNEAINIEAIEVELLVQNPKKTSSLASAPKSLTNQSVAEMDSMNEEDEVEDEKRSPVSMQIIQTSSVT